MAHQIIQERVFNFRSFHINKNQPLGHGSYGAVYKARCDQLPCAAKVLHPTLVNSRDPGAENIMQRFKQECAFLRGIKHPHIVQYLGMTLDPVYRSPVLLMELLDENLTKMLQHSQQPLPYCIQVDICHDVAMAIAYLHSNDIVHRDLSSNNILISAGRRAKVTDFGMSKLSDGTLSKTSLTMCPGTLAYMPPEALREPPKYTKKLDSFSEGVIMIQVCTRMWPEPGPRTQLVPDSRSASGTIEVPILESVRRKSHIDMIDPGHPFLPIAMDCLHYQENERSSSEELCQKLADLKEMDDYKESVEKAEQSQCDMAADAKTKDGQQELVMKWKAGGTLQCKMERGAVAVHGNVVYFLSYYGEMCSYSSSCKSWSDYPNCPDRGCSLAIVDGHPTSIGGYANKYYPTNKLLIFAHGKVKWVEHFPPMPTKRGESISVTTEQHLIVAGGSNWVSNHLCTVEVMDVEALQWSAVTSLPLPYSDASATVCGDQLYIVGGYDETHCGTKTVLTCSITELLLGETLNPIWHKIADTPFHHSTCATVDEELVAFGGMNIVDNKVLDTVYKYNPYMESWDLFSYMPTARRDSLVAVLPNNEIIVVGGYEVVSVIANTFDFGCINAHY